MDIVRKYFHLNPSQEKKVDALGKLYSDWNQKINVISRKDIANIYERHVLHSLAIAKVIHFKEGTQILDAGTGGGFPGIPLAILFPDVRFLLADSIGKKITVVNAIVKELELKNVRALQARVERIEERFDFVISRAVTDLSLFVQWVDGKISSRSFNEMDNGIFYLKGGDVITDIPGLKLTSKIFTLNDFFDEAFFETKKLVYLTRGLAK